MKQIKLFVLFVLMACSANAGLLYPYNRLALKDLDQMNKLVREKIQESRKEKSNRVVPLKEAMQAVYSRPNEDFMIEKIVSPLRNELDDLEEYENAVRALVTEATGALKNPKAFTPVAQATYGIFLENLMAEMKPHAQDSFEKEVITSIRDAKIELTKPAKSERQMRMMKTILSPSEIAGTILKDVEAAEAAKKKEEEDRKKAEEKKK